MFRHKFLSMVLLVGMLFSQSVPDARAATVCDSAQFISDLSYPDGTSVAPGSTFIKKWRLANNGTCAWSTAYRLTWAGGDQMGATSVNMPVAVPSGQMVDISITLTAPSAAGHYKSLWKLSNASGTAFGIGSSSNEAFWVDINVVDTSSVIFDFVSNASYAQWKSGAGNLPFPGTSGDNRGYSFQVNNPHLEDDSFDALPGLLVVPQNKYNGYIQATYPEFQVQAGDKLQTLVNCEFGATGCYVTFRVDYLLPNGVQRTLWQWRESADQRFYRANLDLTSLAGQKVRFVFMLLSSGFASGDRALWGSPRIVRTGSVQPPAPPATLTALPPLTATATPITPPPPTMSPAGCDRATFVSDVTVPDGTQFSPGAAFTKTWRLRNSGSCVWTTAYKLMYYSGDQMSAPTMINLPMGAASNQTIDISVNMVAPSERRSYRGFWILANASGQLFGIGANAANPIWVDIRVAGEPTYEGGYQFWQNACSAEWKSGAGPLPCPGTDGDRKGFVIPQQSTQLEDGTMGPAPSLVIAPENRFNGYIMGTFPAFTVQPGDRFVSGVGCDYNSSCYATFRLDYMTATGYVGTFWQWREQSDRRNYSADVDLTPLAGRSVRFILTIHAAGTATGDRVRWIAPAIIRRGIPQPPTITPPSPTVTPPTVPPPPIVTTPNINDLQMMDSTNGWATGNSYVLRTADGGATWYNVSMPNVSSVRNGFFQTPSKGWVFATDASSDTVSLFRTTNGGTTWTAYHNLPFNGGTIQFLDDLNGFVMTGMPDGMHKHFIEIYQTSNGGANWTLKFAVNPLETTPGVLRLGGIKQGLVFRDLSAGWIGGYSPETGTIYFYQTTNGGTSWTKQVLPIPPGYENADLNTIAPTFFGTNDAVLPVWMTTGIGQRDLFLYVTHDGGATWNYSTGFARNADRIEFLSTRDAFSWNRGGFMQATNDGGATWRQITSNYNFGETVRDIDFVSTSTGWVLDMDDQGNTALYRTTDGSSTWTLLFGTPAPPPAQLLPDLLFTGVHIELRNTSCFDPADTMGVRVWVKNNGNSIAPQFTVRVNGVDQTTNSYVGIGETAVLFFPGYSNPVTAILDPAGLIQESDESNNTRSEMVAVPTAPLPCVTPETFSQEIVTALNARNFDLAKSKMMGQSFTMAFWQSQGNSYPPDAAIQQIQSYMNVSTVLTADPSRDLVALLGGANPYQPMGLDAATSRALFVSGWGADAKDEMILYVKQLPNGNWYWYGMLVAPGGFARFLPTQTALQGPYAVARVAPNDVLNIRGGAGVNFAVVGWFPPDATHIMRTGLTQSTDGAEWWQIQREDGLQGWVNSNYLTEYVTPNAFCNDGRVLTMIEQLKSSMIQQNGNLFATMVGPKQGIAINLWRGVPAVRYTNITARGIFTDTASYDWGSPPGVGGPGISGTFAQIVRPQFVDVFNSTYQLGCDNPSYAAGMSADPWPNTNIHFYSITKPPTANVFDWKVWLIGFEYVDGTPYLYSTLEYIWEP